MADNMTASGLQALEQEYQAIVKAAEAEAEVLKRQIKAANMDVEVLEARLGGALVCIAIAFVLGFIAGVIV